MTPNGAAQSNWPQFRGPNGQGVLADARPPVVFGPGTNVAWRVDVGPGLSSPVIWGGRLFLTTYETGRLALASWDRADGRRQWEWAASAGPISDVHSASSPAAPTPAVDGERVYGYFGSWGLVAVKHDGVEAWRRPMAPPRNRYGMASSPILHGGRLILALDADDGKSRIAAFDAATGQTAWEADRAGQRATWSTPAIYSGPGAGGAGEELIVLSAMRLASYDPRDGKELWSLDGFPQETVSVPVMGDGLIYAGAAALGGRGNEQYDAMGWRQLLEFDANRDGLVQATEIPDDFRMVLRPDLPKTHPGYAVPSAFKSGFKGRDVDKDGALSEAEWNQSVAKWEASSRPLLAAVKPGVVPGKEADRIAWKTARGLPEMPSFLHYQGRVWFVRDGGLLTCLDGKDGRLVFQERIGAPGQYAASPVAADGRIYLASANGTVVVVKASGDSLEVLARNALGEAIHATPALAGAAIYVRTAAHLWALGDVR